MLVACLGTQFGKRAVSSLSERTKVYEQTYDALLASLQAGGSYRGALFWRWNNDEATGGTPQDGSLVFNGDQTYLCAPLAYNTCEPRHTKRQNEHFHLKLKQNVHARGQSIILRSLGAMAEDPVMLVVCSQCRF